MSEYSISNFITQLQTVYTLNIVTFLQNKTLNYSNYIFFAVFLLVRVIAFYFLGYQLSVLNIILMLIQSVLLLGTGFNIYNLFSNVYANKGVLAILLVFHLILLQMMYIDQENKILLIMKTYMMLCLYENTFS